MPANVAKAVTTGLSGLGSATPTSLLDDSAGKGVKAAIDNGGNRVATGTSTGGVVYLTTFPSAFYTPQGSTITAAPQRVVRIVQNKLGNNMLIFALVLALLGLLTVTMISCTKWTERRKRNDVENRWDGVAAKVAQFDSAREPSDQRDMIAVPLSPPLSPAYARADQHRQFLSSHSAYSSRPVTPNTPTSMGSNGSWSPVSDGPRSPLSPRSPHVAFQTPRIQRKRPPMMDL